MERTKVHVEPKNTKIFQFDKNTILCVQRMFPGRAQYGIAKIDIRSYLVTGPFIYTSYLSAHYAQEALNEIAERRGLRLADDI